MEPRKHAHYPSTSAPILPAEIISEILSRLPVKSLLQFRCVSKSWLALISSPQFVESHLNLSANNINQKRLMLSYTEPVYNLKDCSLTSLLYDSVMETSDLNYPMKSTNSYFWIVGSVNGLICISRGATGLFLWNPSIRKYKKLSDSSLNLKRANSIQYGFGYDEFQDDYKVVRFINSSIGAEVEIFSLKMDSWRIIHGLQDGLQLFGFSKFVNGKLHWANNVSPVLSKGWNIIFLDLAYEKWGKVEQPYHGVEDGVLVPGVLGSNLSVICNGYDKRIGLDIKLDVWVMKEYGVKESWTKIFTIKWHYDPMALVCNPSFLVSNEDEILFMFKKTFLLYNRKDELIRYQKLRKFGSGLVDGIYTESLVCPLSQYEPRRQRE